MNLSIRTSLFMSLLLLTAAGQVGVQRAIGQRTPLIITMQGIYEQVNGLGANLKETSFPFSMSVPLSRRFAMGMRTGGASARARGATPLSGLGDGQMYLRYSQNFIKSSLSVSLGLNLPSGKKALSLDELGTAIFLSQPFFGFQTAGFGQGFNVTPSVVWAIPVSSNIILGLVGKYSANGGFSPLENMEALYKPGNEVMLGLGLDLKLSATASLSTDGSIALYAKDRLGAEEVFGAGKKLSFSMMFRKISDFDELRVTARYVDQEKGSVMGSAAGILRVQTLANLSALTVFYKWRATRKFYLGFSAGAQHYGASTLYPSQTLGTVRVMPTFRLSEKIDVLLLSAYTYGNFTGIDAGGGLQIRI